MKNKPAIAITMGLVSWPGAVYAATGDVTFTGTVNSTCSLAVSGASGTLVPSSNLLTLSSKLSGGSAGTVSVTTTGGSTVSVDAVTVSTKPTADTATTIWVPSFSISGLATVADRTTPQALTTSGSGTINVNLVGTKTGSVPFVTGTYTATVTVRCEP